MIQLKSCVLVARKWRRGAQQLIHRVVCIDDETSDPVRFLKLYSNDRTAIKNEQARSSNGQIWRFPKILIIRSAPPQGFSSWLEIPEFQAFAVREERYTTRRSLEQTRDSSARRHSSVYLTFSCGEELKGRLLVATRILSAMQTSCSPPTRTNGTTAYYRELSSLEMRNACLRRVAPR